MTDATSAEALAEKLEARAEYWEGRCNRLNYGACQTRACLVRGGWKRGDPVDYDLATCETREACITDTTAASLLRSQSARIEEMERALADAASALTVALETAAEAHEAWDKDHDARVGKLLIALIDPSLKYRAAISAMHESKARVDALLNASAPRAALGAQP